VNEKPAFLNIQQKCSGPATCPLSCVAPGTTVCIKGLAAGPELIDRLRELGFCEEQKIKLVSRNSNYICQVCNARLGISQKVADVILVEALPEKPLLPALDADAASACSELECSR
jgi:Fe2+ transport system protein FeoA